MLYFCSSAASRISIFTISFHEGRQLLAAQVDGLLQAPLLGKEVRKTAHHSQRCWMGIPQRLLAPGQRPSEQLLSAVIVSLLLGHCSKLADRGQRIGMAWAQRALKRIQAAAQQISCLGKTPLLKPQHAQIVERAQGVGML